MEQRTTDSLELELTSLESHIGRVRRRQMTLLAELDRRQVALADGCRSMNEWAASRLDIAPETASALVRTARTAPRQVETALAAGDITFDRAAELARLAAAGVEDPMTLGLRFDIAGLRRHTSSRHRLPLHSHDERYLAMQPNLDESSWRLWGLLPGTDGRIVEEALARRADTFPPLPDGTKGTRRQRAADALTSIAQDSLTGTIGSDASTPLLTVFVDLDAASNTVSDATLDSGPRLGTAALDELLCNTRIETIVTRGSTPLAVGRRTRTIKPALRRAVLHRDGGACTADGCQSRYRLEPHHIVPFSQGGRTDPDNLVSLCWFHHHVVVHGMGYRIDPTAPPLRRRFLPPRDPPGPDPP